MKFPKLTNGQYERIKQFLLMVVPAATAVITGIGVTFVVYFINKVIERLI